MKTSLFLWPNFYGFSFNLIFVIFFYVLKKKKRCAPLEKPEWRRDCTTPCPQDCAFSEWSDWSLCSASSASSSAQTRIRVVVRPPSSGGLPCPALVQKRSCLNWQTVESLEEGSQGLYDLRWIVAPWSRCHLTVGARCGKGVAIRSNLITIIKFQFDSFANSNFNLIY